MRKRLIIWLTIFEIMAVWIGIGGQVSAAETEEEQSRLKEEMIDQFDFEDINDVLKDLFPEEKMDFKETLLGILSGDLTFSAELLNRLLEDQVGYAF